MAVNFRLSPPPHKANNGAVTEWAARPVLLRQTGDVDVRRLDRHYFYHVQWSLECLARPVLSEVFAKCSRLTAARRV